MQGFDKKKINFIIIFIFGYFSIYNISKFNNYDSLKSISDDDLIELTADLSYEQDSLNPDEEEKFKLTKKKGEVIDEKGNKLEIAKLTNQDISSDYFDDEKNLNLSLIPIFETMLFSGIPNPKQKPIPERDVIFKSTAITVKNKKSLSTTLDKFLDKKEAKLVFDRVNDFIDYKIEENLKLMSDESDQIIEINTYIKDYRQLNSRRNKNKDFVFYYQDAPTETKVIRKRMKVKNSLSNTLKSAGIPKKIVQNYLHHLSYTMDFQRDVRNGDLIELLYEANFTKSNVIIGNPLLIYGLVHLRDHKLELFRYRLQNGNIDYFDANGKSIRKHLMRTPVQGARLTSKFGVRKHPILGYSKMHRGVDFAAKRGTPIMAAGDGRVSFAGRNGSFGRFIEIKHLNNFKTRYAHMYKFAKGIKKGRVVKQGDVIGYVGNSGRSTGPHLHYEVKHKNRTINPMKLKLQSSANIEDDDRPNFYANVSLTRERFLSAKLQESETARID
jgi:murein DD-endopeptidase MepM/ murein hydrolase activator NlpD